MAKSLPRIAWIIIILISAALLSGSPLHAQDSRRAEVTRVDYEFERNGIRFYIDFDIYNMRDQDVQVLLWFLDSGDEFLGDGGWDDEYSDSQGNIVVKDVVRPCCDTAEYSRANGYTVGLFVPFNRFPSVEYDYTYTPLVVIRAASDNAELARYWSDEAIRVLGTEAPVGYQVWLSIRGITAHDIQEDGLLEDGEDELLLTYGLAEVTADGYWGSSNMYAWSNIMRTGQTIGPDDFPWIYIDAVASSQVWAGFIFTEVDDYSGAQEYIGLVNASLGGLALVTTPLTLAPPYAGGIAIATFISGVADITINVIALLDTNDSFGDPVTELTPSNLRGIAATGEPWDDYYTFYSDDHRYTVNYSIYIEPYYRHQQAN